MSASLQNPSDLRQQLQQRASENLAVRGVSTSDLWSTKPSGNLTREEQARLDRQRANKRKWAQKERARSKKEMEDLKQTNGTLYLKNQELKCQVQKLQQRCVFLRGILVDHTCVSSKPANPRLVVLSAPQGHPSACTASSAGTRAGRVRHRTGNSTSGWTAVRGSRLTIQNGIVSSRTEETPQHTRDSLDLESILKSAAEATQSMMDREPHGSDTANLPGTVVEKCCSRQVSAEEQRGFLSQTSEEDECSSPLSDGFGLNDVMDQGKSFMELLEEASEVITVDSNSVMSTVAEVPAELMEVNTKDCAETERIEHTQETRTAPQVTSSFSTFSAHRPTDASQYTLGAETGGVSLPGIASVVCSEPGFHPLSLDAALSPDYGEGKTKVVVVFIREEESRRHVGVRNTKRTHSRQHVVKTRPMSTSAMAARTQRRSSWCGLDSGAASCGDTMVGTRSSLDCDSEMNFHTCRKLCTRKSGGPSPGSSATITSMDTSSGQLLHASPTPVSRTDRDSKAVTTLKAVTGQDCAATVTTSRRSQAWRGDLDQSHRATKRTRHFSLPSNAAGVDDAGTCGRAAEDPVDDTGLVVDSSIITDVLGINVSQLIATSGSFENVIQETKCSEETAPTEHEFSLGGISSEVQSSMTIESTDDFLSSTAILSPQASGLSPKPPTLNLLNVEQGGLVSEEFVVGDHTTISWEDSC